MNKNSLLINKSVIACSLFLSGLTFMQAAYATSESKPDSLNTVMCLIKTFDDIDLCPVGYPVTYKRDRISMTRQVNETSLDFVANFCSVTDPIYIREDGVVCIYSGMKKLITPEYSREEKRSMNQSFLDSIKKPSSDWVKVNEHSWYRLVSRGTGAKVTLPATLTLTQQDVTRSGNKIGNAKTSIDTLTVNTKSSFTQYPIGTTLEFFWWKDDVADAHWTQFTMESFAPIKKSKN